jgi:hypothetical protein
MNLSHNVRDLYSDVFRTVRPISGHCVSEIAHGRVTGDSGGNPPIRTPDNLPPLVTKSTSASSRNSGSNAIIHSINGFQDACNASRVELSVYDHHCKFAFMRSQLSRLLHESDASEICCLSSSSNPTFSDFVLSSQRLDDESLDRMLSILRLRISNRTN